MKKYFGNYLGIVVARTDTESRGRLKVYIPHIMPVLNANLLNLFGIQGEETISFNSVGDNLSGGIPETARKYLENILPYAEPASPIIGSSSPGIMGSGGKVSQNAIGVGNVDKSALVPGNAGVVATPTTSKIISPTPSTVPNSTTTTSISSTTPPKPVDNNIIPTTNDGYSCPASYNITTNGNKQYITLAEAQNINRCNVIGSKLVGFVPKDGASYGITSGSVEEWTSYFSRQMLTESAHTGGTVQVNDSFRESNGVISEGLFSLTVGEQGLTSSTITNPVSNSAAAIKISANLITADGVIAGRSSSGGWLGAARYFGPLREGKVKVNGEGVGTYNQSPNASGNQTTSSSPPAGNQTMTTSNISPAPYDTTNVAKGVFSVPQVGALLWCFFREGNPLFPVYFAASYRSGEWSSAYKSSSPGVNNDTSLDGDATRSSTTIMPTKGGGVISTEGAGSHEVSMVSYSGGHLKFHENHTILYSPDDFHTQADGNKFDITLSNRETHTKGICNTVVNGDCFEKIGNVTDQSVHDAINGIESLISKINDEMLKHS